MKHTANPKRLPSPARGGAGGGGHALSQGLAINRIQNQLHHALDIPRNLWIPEPHHLKLLRHQPLVPTPVTLPTMPTTINLDN